MRKIAFIVRFNSTLCHRRHVGIRKQKISHWLPLFDNQQLYITPLSPLSQQMLQTTYETSLNGSIRLFIDQVLNKITSSLCFHRTFGIVGLHPRDDTAMLM